MKIVVTLNLSFKQAGYSMKNYKNYSQTNFKKDFQNAFLSLLALSLASNLPSIADQYSSAFGPQAVMSPATTSSLNIGGNSAPNNSSSSPYNPGNGVYLTGQAAISPNPAMSSSMNPGMMQPASPSMMQSMPYGMSANPYYGQQSQSMNPSMGMYSAMPNSMPQSFQTPYPGQMPMNSGYSQTPFANANTYEAYKPPYGAPPHMVQRNSASFMSESLPYRNRPQVVLNPNSMTGMQQGPKPNDAISGILNGPRQSNARTIPGANWLGKVFRKDPAVAAQPMGIQNTPTLSKPSRW